MNLPRFLIQSRGPLNLARRIPTILWRFGLGPGRIERRLNTLLQITERYGVRPTLPVTAAPLRRHPGVIRRLQQKGVELALHGLVHTDYTSLAPTEHIEQMEQAARVLREHGIRFWGARAPYMRANETTLNVAAHLQLLWDSNDVRHWEVLEDVESPPAALKAYEKVLDLYDSRSATEAPVIPHRIGDVIEIPVSLPDDEAMVDRLALGRRPEAMTRIWLRILQATHQRGDIFTVQLHHERVDRCAPALQELLRQARLMRPGVWVAPLREIAAWWREKARYRVTLERRGSGHRVRVEAGPRAVLQVRHPEGGSTDGWRLERDRDLFLDGERRPLVGITPRSGTGLRGMLEDEGIPYEETSESETHALHLDQPDPFPPDRHFAILARVECAEHPLVRFARWPGGARSALAVTGDIDSLTVWDFFWRVREV